MVEGRARAALAGTGGAPGADDGAAADDASGCTRSCEASLLAYDGDVAGVAGGVRLTRALAAAGIVVAGCIPPRIDLGHRPADPEAWYFGTAVDDTPLRGGTDTRARRAVIERPGSWSVEVDAFGADALRTFAAVAPSGRPGSALVLAAEEGASSIALVAVRTADGDVLAAAELPVGAPVHIGATWLVPADGGAVAAVTVKPVDGAPVRTLLVRVDAEGAVLWSTWLARVGSVHSLATHPEHGVVASLDGISAEGRGMHVIASLTKDGVLRWMRPLLGPSLRERGPAGASFTGAGDVVCTFAARATTTNLSLVGVARLDAEGALRWARSIARPIPPGPPGSHPGVFVQGIGAAGEDAFVAATVPTSRIGSTKLVLVTLDREGSVTRQRAVPASTAKPIRVSVEADDVLVRADDMAQPCRFPARGVASCRGTESTLALSVTDETVSVGPPIGSAAEGPSRTRALTLRARRRAPTP